MAHFGESVEFRQSPPLREGNWGLGTAPTVRRFDAYKVRDGVLCVDRDGKVLR